MRLRQLMIEASRTSDSPRLNARAAETVLRAVIEWIEEQPRLDNGGSVLDTNHGREVVEALAQRMRDEIIIGRLPK